MRDVSSRRWRLPSLENWGVRWKVTAVLAVPLIVAMVFGALRVQSELSDAVHYSSAADQMVEIPPIVALEAAVGTVLPAQASGTLSRDDMATFDAAIADMTKTAHSPDLAAPVAAELGKALTAAEALRTQVQGGITDAAALGENANTSRSSLVNAADAILSPIDDHDIQAAKTKLIDTWLAQRRLSDEAMTMVQYLGNINTPPTHYASVTGAEQALLDTLTRDYPADDQNLATLHDALNQRMRMFEQGIASKQLPVLEERQSLLESLATYHGMVKQATDEITQGVQAKAIATRSAALRDAAIVLGTLLAAMVLALLVSRSLVSPIRRLRHGALQVARRDLPDAIDRIKVGDTVDEFNAVPVYTTEEIGQLARAVDDIHGQALRLAGEQAHLRLQVNDMFETLARRSKTLVDQQLGLIEALEYEEKDPKRLESLFRLDHLAARMRRNGDNLLVLSGMRSRRGPSAPVALSDVLRAAISEVENYQRVKLGSTPEGALSGSTATDVVHLLAELLDNALRASPPDTMVSFSFAQAIDGGLLLEISDRGIGIPRDELAAINSRLSTGAEITPETARHMGLFVVSRLAERYGITVRLRPTVETKTNPGVTVSVHLPQQLMVAPLAIGMTGPQQRVDTGAQPAVVRGELESAPAPQQPAPTVEQRDPTGPMTVTMSIPGKITTSSGLPQRRPGSHQVPALGVQPDQAPPEPPAPTPRPAAPERSADAPVLPQRTPAPDAEERAKRIGGAFALPQRRPVAPQADAPQAETQTAAPSAEAQRPVTPQTVAPQPDETPAADAPPVLPQRQPGRSGVSALLNPSPAAPRPSIPAPAPTPTPAPAPAPATASAAPAAGSAPAPAAVPAAEPASTSRPIANPENPLGRHRSGRDPEKTASFFRPRVANPSGPVPPVAAPTADPEPAESPIPDDTPIFADMVSMWLTDPTEQSAPAPTTWTSPADEGWSAAQRASEEPVRSRTDKGLPQRLPGHRLVPGSVGSDHTGDGRQTRDAASIRTRLSRHQQGVRDGRSTVAPGHSAPPSQGAASGNTEGDR
ncbi:ATP-binding protein [Speluncibacter jeojiensis]|uniref:histidine kinase n=1 Tax=Speluncibacter jeojiensis TaxID=2710754 RepID=A0A9X4RFA3_9ACTN|nr:ATP-binding protein [Corynebacteriales bacterium D3-21]